MEKPGDTDANGQGAESEEPIEPPEPAEPPEQTPDDPLGEDWDPDNLPRIFNAESLDQAELKPGQLLALRFSGEGIGRTGAPMRLVAELLEAVHRILTGLQPVASGVRVALSGATPRLPGIEPPTLQGAATGRSITFVLGLAGEEARLIARLGPEEVRRLERRAYLTEPPDVAALPEKSQIEESETEIERAAQFPTLAAAHWMTEVLAASPGRAVQKVQHLGRRATRDYLKIVDVLAEHHLDTSVRSHDEPRAIEVPSERSFAVAERLRKTEQTHRTTYEVRGGIYQADARNHRFRLITEDGGAVLGSYLPEMLGEVRKAWAKLVRAKITRIDYQWVGADEPHRTAYQLDEVVRILGDADDLLTPEA